MNARRITRGAVGALRIAGRALGLAMIIGGAWLVGTTTPAHAAVPLKAITNCDTAVAAMNASLTTLSRSRLALKDANASHSKATIKRAKIRLAVAASDRDIVRGRIKTLCGAGGVSAQSAVCGPTIDKLAATIDSLAAARRQLNAKRAKPRRAKLQSEIQKLEKTVDLQSLAMQKACEPALATSVAAPPGGVPSVPVAAPDTTAPVLTISVQSPTNDTTPHVGLSANESGAAIACRLDGSAIASPASFDLPVLAEGSHTLACDGVDTAGNVGHAAATIVVDTVAPAAPSVGGPIGPTAQKTISGFIVILGDAGNSAQCRIDNGAYAQTNAGSFTGTFTAGVHQVFCRLTDAAGNAGPDGTPVTITILA